ncbi:MAG TPA: hypothetical protein IAA58_11205 [Candidatus Gallacutalibacter stercoravium]|nr:hypothetical protein [Candidatus Gallacutalibacter stercoravium]
MAPVSLKLEENNKTVAELDLTLNGSPLPRPGDQIFVDKRCYTVRGLSFETQANTQDGSYFISKVRLLAQTETP